MSTSARQEGQRFRPRRRSGRTGDIDEVIAAVDECAALKAGELHVLGWEWEMGLNDLMRTRLRSRASSLCSSRSRARSWSPGCAARATCGSSSWPTSSRRSKATTLSPRVQVSLEELRHPEPRTRPRRGAREDQEVVGLRRLLGGRLGLPRRHVHAGLGDLPHRRDRRLALSSDPHTYEEPGKYHVMIKVIDIFGNDTSKIFDVEVH